VPNRDVIVIGGSTGAISALAAILRTLPEDLHAALFVVIHIPPYSPGYLPSIFQRDSKLRCSHAEDGAPIQNGNVYFAPPDFHLEVRPGHMHLTQAPKENRHRPAVNPLFRSAANHYKERVSGVIVSGHLDDGAAGLWHVKQMGGATIVQDPRDAEASSMPSSALDGVSVDYCLPSHQIGGALLNLVNSTAPPVTGVAAKESRESTLSCPDCNGHLTEHRLGEVYEWSCRIGHKFSPHGLLEAQEEELERRLWMAINHLEEGAELARQLQLLMPKTRGILRDNEQKKRYWAEQLRHAFDDLAEGREALREEEKHDAGGSADQARHG
jgi:two-component system chemotaxis response regulator CheB